MTSIRPARRTDLAVIRQIEQAAGELFRDIGMADIADHPLPSLEVLSRYQQDGRAWVGVDDEDRPIAFVLVELVDGNAHIEQVSVHPGCAHRRIGRDLIDHVAAWAAERHRPALTLTTFRDVPWNGPYYARLGFSVIEVAGPELAALMADEAAHGLDPTDRIAMVRPIHRDR